MLSINLTLTSTWMDQGMQKSLLSNLAKRWASSVIDKLIDLSHTRADTRTNKWNKGKKFPVQNRPHNRMDSITVASY